MDWISGLITGLSSLLGGHQTNTANARQAELNRRFQDAQILRQMQFQYDMSRTAHQREVADLRDAGLNPILSAKYGGSSTPSGASGSGAQASMVDPLTPAISTALQYAKTKQELKNMRKQGNLLDAQAKNVGVNTAKGLQDLRIKSPMSTFMKDVDDVYQMMKGVTRISADKGMEFLKNSMKQLDGILKGGKKDIPTIVIRPRKNDGK